MHGVLPALEAKANRRVAKGVTRKIVENNIPFRDLAELAWPKPKKPAAELVHLTGADIRTARRWLEGKGCTPWSAVSVVLQEIIRRLE